MKHIKRLTVWILISLIIQFVGLFYANNYLFANTSKDIKIKKVVNEDTKKKIDDSVKRIDISKDAKGIKASFNGKYVTYTKGESIYVLNLDDGEENKIKFATSEDGYFWLSDRNRMLITQKNGSTMEISHYDSDKKDSAKDMEIKLSDSAGKVVDMDESPINQMKYFKVNYGTSRSNVYSFNINNDIERVNVKTTKVGNVECINRKDMVVYEDKSNNRINVTNSTTTYKPKEGNKIALLKVDSEDIIYIAETDDAGKVKQISYGSAEEKETSWKNIQVMEDVLLKDVIVTEKSDILFNDNLKGEVKSIISGKSYKYEGKLLGVVEGFTISYDDVQIIKTKLK